MGAQTTYPHPSSHLTHGGLVIKAGLAELTADDRAALYGALLAVAEKLCSEDRDRALALWKQKGRQAFETEAGINSAARRVIALSEGC